MMKTKLFDKSIPKFLLVGLLNSLLSAILMFLLEGLGYWISTAIAYIAGAVLSFFLNRKFTFNSQEKAMKSAVKFAVNILLCYVIAYSLAQPFAGFILSKTEISAIWQERIAKILGMGIYTVINYFGQRFFAFKGK